MRYVVGLLLLLLIGCNTDPEDGDIYENMLTQQRVEVDVGDCKFMNDKIDRYNERQDAVNEEIGRTRKQSILSGDYKLIKYEYLTTDRKCVGYEEVGRQRGIGRAKFYVIMGIDKFKEKFTPVN